MKYLLVLAAVVGAAAATTAPARAATSPSVGEQQAELRLYLGKTKPVVAVFLAQKTEVDRVVDAISGPLWVPTFNKAANDLDTIANAIDPLSDELRQIKPPARLREPHAQLGRGFELAAAGLRDVTEAYWSSGDDHFFAFQALAYTGRAANARLHYWATETVVSLRRLKMNPPYWVSALARTPRTASASGASLQLLAGPLAALPPGV